MAQIRFVGAEVRVDPEWPDPAWEDARRARYLLRRDVGRPLSLDRAVWSSCPMAAGERPPDTLPWVSLEEVSQWAVDAKTTFTLPPVTIVIGLVIEDATDAALAESRGVDSELVAEAGWRLLGFDVSDGAISGLSNCGYEEAEADALRAVWGARLNEHGLFAEVHDALAFRRATDARVPEHAPFAVYALWLASQRDAG